MRIVGGGVAIAALMLSLTVSNSSAQVVATPTIQQVGSLYHYDYSITNNSADTTYYVVSLQGPFGSDAITDLSAPTGFQINFDPGLGLISFLADSQSFDPGTTTSGFVFDSFFKPGDTTIESTGFDGLGNGVITEGTAVGPKSTPEPGVNALLLGMAATGVAAFKRRLKARKSA